MKIKYQKYMSKIDNKMFYNKKEVKASGTLIYKFDDENKMKLLLIKTNGKYEDIGGKKEKEDKDIYDIADREMKEETNNIIFNVKDRLKKGQNIYLQKCKYVLFIIEALDDELKLTKNIFDNKELMNGKERTISWIDKSYLKNINTIKYKLNYRLRHKIIFDILDNIEEKQFFKKNILAQKI